MSENQETTKGILTEMRNLGKLDDESSDKIPRRLMGLGLRTYADRIEAAHKREIEKASSCSVRSTKEAARIIIRNGVVNAAKMYEALVNISKYADCAAMRQYDATTQHYIEQIRKWVDAALAEPPRNCDVGDVRRQLGRFMKLCRSFQENFQECDRCPYHRCVSLESCVINWAQMPYEEGGEK